MLIIVEKMYCEYFYTNPRYMKQDSCLGIKKEAGDSRLCITDHVFYMSVLASICAGVLRIVVNTGISPASRLNTSMMAKVIAAILNERMYMPDK